MGGGIPLGDGGAEEEMIKRRVRVALAMIATLALAAPSIARPILPATAKLADWTPALAKAQPDGAFVVIYKVGKRWLVFIGAEHSNDVNGKTFSLIADAYRHYRLDAVIAEGWPTSLGPNAQQIVSLARQPVGPEGFQKDGETIPTVRGALAQRATL